MTLTTGTDGTALPDFLVIGAAKAGTTALYWHLREHPQVSMSRLKETNFFAYGTGAPGDAGYGDPDLHRFPVRSFAEYAEQFERLSGVLAVGEVSPIYLECPHTAGRIAARLPDVGIVCCLRNPVDRAYSDYLMYLRKRGKRLEPERDLALDAAWARADSHWVRIGRYAELLEPYLSAFPRERIYVYLFDDFVREPLGTVQGIYRFLGVDDGFVPDLTTPHNIGGLPANMVLERLVTSKRLRTAVDAWVPRSLANLVRRVRTSNLQRPPDLPLELRRQIEQHVSDDIARIEVLLGRDLQSWRSHAP